MTPDSRMEKIGETHTVNVDWSQFIPALIATCLGCTLAIFFTSCYDRRNYEKEKKEALQNIINELEKVKNEVNSIRAKTDYNSYFYLSPLKTPFFDSLIHVKKLVLLTETALQKGNETAQQKGNETVQQNGNAESILLLYEYISEYNAWQTWRTNHRNVESDMQLAESCITELEGRILSGIEKYIDILRRNMM